MFLVAKSLYNLEINCLDNLHKVAYNYKYPKIISISWNDWLIDWLKLIFLLIIFQYKIS